MYEYELLDLGRNFEGQYVPPIDSPVIHNATRSELQESPHNAEIVNLLSKVVEAQEWTTGLPAPPVIRRAWSMRKINDEIKTLAGKDPWRRVVRMEQQNSQAYPLPTGARPRIRRTPFSKRGEDLMAATTR